MSFHVGRPWSDDTGWCHNCGVWQLGRHARLVTPDWMDGDSAWVCFQCDDEPWGLGVWNGPYCEDCVVGWRPACEAKQEAKGPNDCDGCYKLQDEMMRQG